MWAGVERSVIGHAIDQLRNVSMSAFELQEDILNIHTQISQNV